MANPLGILPVEDHKSCRTATGSQELLKHAASFYRRNVDKIPTAQLRAVPGDAPYMNNDLISGERFFLTSDEVKAELERRDKLAMKIAEELWNAALEEEPGQAHTCFVSASGESQRRFKRMAEFAIEKNRMRGWPL